MRTLCLALLLTATSAFAFAADPAYVFKRGGRSTIRTSGMPWRSIGKIANRWTGDFIWTRRDGREYLIRDAATLAEAKRAFAELDAMSPQIEVFHKRLHAVEQREEALEDKLESIEERLEDEDGLRDSERRALEARARELEQEKRIVERELRPLEEEERRIDNRQEALERVAEAELEQIIRQAIRRGVVERVD
jgi:hypothetical protein